MCLSRCSTDKRYYMKRSVSDRLYLFESEGNHKSREFCQNTFLINIFSKNYDVLILMIIVNKYTNEDLYICKCILPAWVRTISETLANLCEVFTLRTSIACRVTEPILVSELFLNRSQLYPRPALLNLSGPQWYRQAQAFRLAYPCFKAA